MRSTKLPSWIERLLGVDARPVPPYVFALDERSLRYGAFSRGDGRMQLSELGSVDLGEGAFFEGPLGGPVRDADDFQQQLESLLGQASGRPTDACLVLPDRWLRMVFAEITELPDAPVARHEALRFKLRRLVPFRVEDLRLVGVEVRPLDDQVEPRRVLLSFALQALLDQLETLFGLVGVRIGLIASESASVMAALPRDGAVCLLLGDDTGYTLLVTSNGEPILYRHKSLSHDLDPAVLGSIVGRDLQLTRSFLEEKASSLLDDPGVGLNLWVAADDPNNWAEWAAQGLGAQPQILSRSTLPILAGLPKDLSSIEGAPMFGAALQEVA